MITAISHSIPLHLKSMFTVHFVSCFWISTCSENLQTAFMLTIHSISPQCLQRITCPKSYIVEPKALYMCWATLPVWSWVGGTNSQAGLTAQADCDEEGLDLHPTAHKPSLSLVNSYTRWLHTGLGWSCEKMSFRCSIMIRMWRLGTESTSRYWDWGRGQTFPAVMHTVAEWTHRWESVWAVAGVWLLYITLPAPWTNGVLLPKPP